jgi:SPP1 family phage portal protein
MDAKQIDDLVTKHTPLTTRYYDQKTYKIGENAGIYQLDPRPAPDNRIPVPFVRRATKLIKGYFAKAGNITYASKDKWFEEQLADIYDANDEELETASMFEDAICYGRAFELHWFDEVEGFQFALLPVSQCIPIYSDDIKKKLIAFVWYRKNGDTEIATYYDDVEYQEYRKEKKDKEWTLDVERSGLHLYGTVPVLEAVVDRDKRNVFDHCLPLIDMYDKIISEVGNEHEKFANSILLLKDMLDDTTKDADGKTQLDKIRDYRVLDHLGENVSNAVSYLERNVNDTFINNTLDRYERLIYEMLCIFNPNDDNFAAASGIAQAYKLLGFEYLIADMESYFSQFLYARLRLIAGHKAGIVKDVENVEFVTISFKRNLPFNIESMANIISVLSGGQKVVSQKTLLQLFPASIIPDVDAEILAVKAETPAYVNPFGGAE